MTMWLTRKEENDAENRATPTALNPMATYAFSRNASLDMFCANKFVAKLNTSSDHSYREKIALSEA